MPLHNLTFVSQDATPKTQIIQCTRESIPPIMSWYGSYHAGDDYRVDLDGVNVRIDDNGDAIWRLPV